jgi:hypothetical protein
MNEILDPIRKRFPDKVESIATALAVNINFRTICEDYRDCMHAFKYWSQSEKPEAAARVSEYRTLIVELEKEIADALAEIRPGQ